MLFRSADVFTCRRAQDTSGDRARGGLGGERERKQRGDADGKEQGHGVFHKGGVLWGGEARDGSVLRVGFAVVKRLG